MYFYSISAEKKIKSVIKPTGTGTKNRDIKNITVKHRSLSSDITVNAKCHEKENRKEKKMKTFLHCPIWNALRTSVIA